VKPENSNGDSCNLGAILRLSSDGQRLLGLHRIAAELKDLAVDRKGNIYVAAGKQVAILDPSGKQLAAVTGKAFATDVCIDGASQTVVFTGFRNARAHDGKRNEPVQISYVHALDVRKVGGEVVVVYGGSGAEEGMFLENALQKTARGKDAFLVVLRGDAAALPSNPAKPRAK